MSLKKIAELAGTSVSTVSRVLNQPGHRCNQPELSDRIWEIARQINYLPNEAAKALRLGAAETPGAFYVDIFLTRFDSMEKDPFFYELFCHIKEELLHQGCLLGDRLSTLDVLSLVEDPALKSIPYRPSSPSGSEKRQNPPAFISRKPNTGLIILGKCQRELIPTLKKRYAYIAGIDRNPTDYEYDEVICSGTAAAEKAMEYLISLGHRNIAYIGDCTYESRYIGYYQALMNHRIPLNYANIHPTDQTMEQGFYAMNDMINAAAKPTAVFCANDSTALGALKALKGKKKRGYSPSIISIDNIEHSQNTVPMLTTIDIPKKEMSHLAVMLLIDRRNGRHAENLRIELPCHLIERESCTYPNG